MEREKQENKDAEIPKILTCLTDSIVKLDGQKTEGIFRVPGEAEGVSGKSNVASLTDRAEMSDR